jgi:hypothetical protein
MIRFRGQCTQRKGYVHTLHTLAEFMYIYIYIYKAFKVFLLFISNSDPWRPKHFVCFVLDLPSDSPRHREYRGWVWGGGGGGGKEWRRQAKYDKWKL